MFALKDNDIERCQIRSQLKTSHRTEGEANGEAVAVTVYRSSRFTLSGYCL